MSYSNGAKPPNAQPEVLLASGLRKEYGSRTALKDLSFSLSAGRVLGFLGPNGAGKTTSIRILTTMLEPTSGYFAVDGIQSTQPELIRQKIGVLPEGMGLPKRVTGIEYLTYFGQLYGRSASNARAVGFEILKDVGMQNRGDSAMGGYSHGMRQRLGIARALVNDPKVIFLDEPTLGLDPRGQADLLALIQRVARERNTGIVLCSHLLSEIEGICDDVIIMNAGQVVAKGTVAEVIGNTKLSGDQRNSLRVRIRPTSVIQARQVLSALASVKQVAITDETGGWLTLQLTDKVSADLSAEANARNGILEALIKAAIPIQGFETAGGRLQDVFLQLTAEAIQ